MSSILAFDLRCPSMRSNTMLKTVQLIIGQLLTDEEFRLRFLRDPFETLFRLRDQGYDLTAAEIEALARTDRTLWTDAAERVDRDLRRSGFGEAR